MRTYNHQTGTVEPSSFPFGIAFTNPSNSNGPFYIQAQWAEGLSPYDLRHDFITYPGISLPKLTATHAGL
jgi:hypothetical protein